VIFGETPLDQAEGAILAHSLRRDAINFKKGRVLSAEDVARLATAGVQRVVAARLEPGDVHEDEAAGALAAALTGDHLTASAAFTGRCNLLVGSRGLLQVDHARLDRLNLVDEAVTVATLAPFQPVEPRQMAATIKIIPFAVPGTVLERCVDIARQNGPLVQVRPFRQQRVGLVQTHLPGMKESLLDKTKEAVDGRLAALDCAPTLERRCAHDSQAVAMAIAELHAETCDILLISGASAIVDRRDVVPAGIVAAGGAIDHFGMPVDPGNLILLGRVAERPVIGLPGCARSPKLNGFDWVLQRLVADLPIAKEDLMRMGAGGLLKEIASRPLPRARAVEEPEIDSSHAPRIAALVLAAGHSTRMGAANKLLAQVDGQPMIRRVVETVRRSQAGPIVVVTGHQRAKVEAALADQDVTLVHNPDFAHGLSTSLHRGLGALPATLDGVVVCLGDMPRITAPVIDKLIAAFDPLEGRAICLPTWQGKRGNPVLFAHRFFAEMQEISGDLGARALIGDYPELVTEVPVPEDSVLFDVDTPEALASLNPAS
jgi:molybdenum cofactor cytidylyltransferase